MGRSPYIEVDEVHGLSDVLPDHLVEDDHIFTLHTFILVCSLQPDNMKHRYNDRSSPHHTHHTTPTTPSPTLTQLATTFPSPKANTLPIIQGFLTSPINLSPSTVILASPLTSHSPAVIGVVVKVIDQSC